MAGRWRSLLTGAAAFVLLIVGWKLAKLVLPAAGVSIGDVRVLPRTDDAAMVISSYLAFFPIAVGMLRGLTSPARADVELFATMAAGWWTTRLRLPASVPH